MLYDKDNGTSHHEDGQTRCIAEIIYCCMVGLLHRLIGANLPQQYRFVRIARQHLPKVSDVWNKQSG